MSEVLAIGLSKEQIAQLLKGHTIGKRPYADNQLFPPDRPIRYDSTKRIYVKLLIDNERAEEPTSAFEW